MSKAILLNTGWIFTKEGHDEPVTLPHTWNAVDGQDGGNDYYRGTCSYTRILEKPELPNGGRAVLQFDGVAMTAVVNLNGEKVAEHKGGYSTFRVDITDALHDGANELMVSVDNSDNDTVYPQKADFTFYGGIYRDVTLHVVPAAHFALAENGAVPVKVTPAVTDLDERRCEVTVEAFVVGAQSVNFTLDGQQTSAAVKDGTEMGLKAKSFMDAGALVPDEVIIGILKERLAQPDCANGFILDGVPRTIAQAEAIEKMGIRIDKVLELSVADDVIVNRMGGRRVCEKCGASYHIVNKKSKVEGVCDCCGGKLVIRKDDQPATVLDRLKAYHEQTEPLVDFYRQRGKLAVIPFNDSIEATTAEIMKALEA